MRKNVLRIFSGLLAVLMFSVAIVPASAVGTSASRSDFFTWTNGFGGGKYGGGASRGDSESAYDEYVQGIQNDYSTTEFGNSGIIIPIPIVDAVNLSPTSNRRILDFSSGYPFSVAYSGFRPGYSVNLMASPLTAPVSGTYWLSADLSYTNALIGVNYPVEKVCVKGETVAYISATDEETGLSCACSLYNSDSSSSALVEGRIYFFVEPTAYDVNNYTANIGGINSRPTSITGGNYGIVGDNGQITKVEDNSTIINETNNTYYNPATGQTQPITAWSYDYSDRSYKLTLDGGNTSTVTYGDENISITETTVNESGDTITNNYTIYYLIDGSGETPVDPPAACEHDWQESSSTDPTCTLPGKVTLSCTKCQQTKTETIPALGHDWQVKQTVTTQYDDTGQLTQQGYTIFECSRCHEQYKSTDGTIPPGGGSGTDPGDGEEKETIWQKIGKLFGTLGNGMLGMLEAVVGKLLDGLNSLAEMLVEKLKTVVATVLSIFDELPLLFGGFLDFLAAVFPFLPPELMTILTFGVIAVVFIGILKAVRR